MGSGIQDLAVLALWKWNWVWKNLKFEVHFHISCDQTSNLRYFFTFLLMKPRIWGTFSHFLCPSLKFEVLFHIFCVQTSNLRYFFKTLSNPGPQIIQIACQMPNNQIKLTNKHTIECHSHKPIPAQMFRALRRRLRLLLDGGWQWVCKASSFIKRAS